MGFIVYNVVKVYSGNGKRTTVQFSLDALNPTKYIYTYKTRAWNRKDNTYQGQNSFPYLGQTLSLFTLF